MRNLFSGILTLSFCWANAQLGLTSHDTLLWQQDTYYTTGPGGSGQGPQNHYTYYNFLLKGDTIVNGVTYKKLYDSGSSGVPGFGGAPIYFYTFLLCDSERVYMGSPGNMTLVLDNNLNVGDSFLFRNYLPKQKLLNIDSIFIAGSYRKRFNFEHGIKWAKGIGDIVYGAHFGLNGYSFLYPASYPLMGYGADFRCYAENFSSTYGGLCSYVGVDELTENSDVIIFPVPVSNDLYVQTSNASILEVNIFDVLGKEWLNTTTPHIDVAEIPLGIYMVRVKASSGIFAKRIVVQR